MNITIQQIREAAIEELAPFSPAAIYLYGSYAKGRARPDSDVGVAFLPGIEVDALALSDTASHLEVLLGGKIGVLDLSRSNTAVRVQVFRDGVALQVQDERARQEYEMRVLSDHCWQNEERERLALLYRRSASRADAPVVRL